MVAARGTHVCIAGKCTEAVRCAHAYIVCVDGMGYFCAHTDMKPMVNAFTINKASIPGLGPS